MKSDNLGIDILTGDIYIQKVQPTPGEGLWLLLVSVGVTSLLSNAQKYCMLLRWVKNNSKTF